MTNIPHTNNPYVTRVIRCTWVVAGEEHTYDFISYAHSDRGAINEANDAVLWSKLETFKAEVHKYSLYW